VGMVRASRAGGAYDWLALAQPQCVTSLVSTVANGDVVLAAAVTRSPRLASAIAAAVARGTLARRLAGAHQPSSGGSIGWGGREELAAALGD
jgi:hypothetical protein